MSGIEWERGKGLDVQASWLGCVACLAWAIALVLLGGLLVRVWEWELRMTWPWIVAGAVVVAGLGFAWCMARMASLSDDSERGAALGAVGRPPLRAVRGEEAAGPQPTAWGCRETGRPRTGSRRPCPPDGSSAA